MSQTARWGVMTQACEGELWGSGEPQAGTCSRKDHHVFSQSPGLRTHSRL